MDLTPGDPALAIHRDQLNALEKKYTELVARRELIAPHLRRWEQMRHTGRFYVTRDTVIELCEITSKGPAVLRRLWMDNFFLNMTHGMTACLKERHEVVLEVTHTPRLVDDSGVFMWFPTQPDVRFIPARTDAGNARVSINVAFRSAHGPNTNNVGTKFLRPSTET